MRAYVNTPGLELTFTEADRMCAAGGTHCAATVNLRPVPELLRIQFVTSWWTRRVLHVCEITAVALGTAIAIVIGIMANARRTKKKLMGSAG